ncbi:hypothetical protein ACO0LG_07830 [Undibacterium sp. Ji42W]|uniref:hypothetical protein n=1 Tax=Undibacterium sp. Ji42W TaxID=3413039 RepID=UPI003BEFC73C
MRYWKPQNPTSTLWELYNLDADPNENHNLLQWDKSTGAPMLRSGQIVEPGLNLAQTEFDLAYLRKTLNQALIKAGYTPQNIQDMGKVADGQAPS